MCRIRGRSTLILCAQLKDHEARVSNAGSSGELRRDSTDHLLQPAGDERAKPRWVKEMCCSHPCLETNCKVRSLTSNHQLHQSVLLCRDVHIRHSLRSVAPRSPSSALRFLRVALQLAHLAILCAAINDGNEHRRAVRPSPLPCYAAQLSITTTPSTAHPYNTIALDRVTVRSPCRPSTRMA